MPIPEDLVVRTPIDRAAALALREGEHFEFKETASQRNFVPLPVLSQMPKIYHKKPGVPNVDRTGQVFGRLTVIGPYDDPRNRLKRQWNRKFRWVVRCACGAYETSRSRRLDESKPASLMCRHCQILEERKAGRGPWLENAPQTVPFEPTVAKDPELNCPKRWLDYKKSPIPPALRWTVWARDDFRCRHCGTRKHLSIDHVIAESKGGKTEVDNLQTLCQRCNSKKGVR